MKKNCALGSGLSHGETAGGLVYFVFQLLFLPPLLLWVNQQLAVPVTDAELNFIYYLTNFIAVVLIFHSFLGRSMAQVWQHPAYFCQAVILGLAAYYACSWAVEQLALRLVPAYTNWNDASIAEMSHGSFFLTAVGTVILVPTVEECFYRGLIFRTLYGKSRWAAYLVSMLAFTAVHIMGYLGQYSAVELMIALAQYLPAGLCLAWSYTKADTIFAPILIHTIINFTAIQTLR